MTTTESKTKIQRSLPHRVAASGACRWQHGPGGAAVHWIGSDGQSRQHFWTLTDTTHNRADLIAVIEGLALTPNKSQVEIYTTSNYIANGTHHLKVWARNGWKNKGRRKSRRIRNLGLWKRLHRLTTRRQVNFHRAGSGKIAGTIERTRHNAYLTSLRASDGWAERSNEEVEHLTSIEGDGVPDELVGLDIVHIRPTEDHYVDPEYLPAVGQKKAKVKNAWYGSGRGARYEPVDASNPWAIPVDKHSGSHRDYLTRYTRAAEAATHEITLGRTSTEANSFLRKMFEYASEFRMLRCAYDLTAQSGATARGVDGFSIEEYAEDRELLYTTLRSLEKAIREGTYSPKQLRRVNIPKRGNRGTRPIDIPTVEDRIVDRAILLALAPLLEPTWHECNVGFRKGRGVQTGLAMLEWHVRKGPHTVARAVDIRRAFTAIPKPRLVTTVRKAIPKDVPDELAKLMEKIIQRPLPSGAGIKKGRGIPQGSPLSPMLLNLYMNKYLDRKWNHQQWPLIRYADDILLLATSKKDADEALRTLRNLLTPTGLSLRDEAPPPAEIASGDTVEWLGFQAAWNGHQMELAIGEHEWYGLEEGLQFAVTDTVPTIAIKQVIGGWLEFAGPTYRRGEEGRQFREDFVNRVEALVQRTGADGTMAASDVIEAWRTAGKRWRDRKGQVQRRLERRSTNGTT